MTIDLNIVEKPKRGRPRKYATPEEAKSAKTAKSVESNKRRKAAVKVGGDLNGVAHPTPLAPQDARVGIPHSGAHIRPMAPQDSQVGKGLATTPQGDKIYPLTLNHILRMFS